MTSFLRELDIIIINKVSFLTLFYLFLLAPCSYYKGILGEQNKLWINVFNSIGGSFCAPVLHNSEKYDYKWRQETWKHMMQTSQAEILESPLGYFRINNL